MEIVVELKIVLGRPEVSGVLRCLRRSSRVVRGGDRHRWSRCSPSVPCSLGWPQSTGRLFCSDPPVGANHTDGWVLKGGLGIASGGEVGT